MTDAERRKALRKGLLLADLGDEAWAMIDDLVLFRAFEAGAFLFREGDEADVVYLILSGTCEVVQTIAFDEFEGIPTREGQVVLQTLEAGDSVGELPLLVPAPRSASVRAATALEVATLPIEPLREAIAAAAASQPFGPLVTALQKTVVSRLSARRSDTVSLHQMQHQLLRQRSRANTLLVALSSLLCAWFFLTHWLTSMSDLSSGTTVLTLPLVILLLVVSYRPIQSLELPWRVYGIKREGWAAAAWDGLLFSLPPIVIMTLAKALWAPDMPLFDLVSTLAQQKGSYAAAWWHFVGFGVAYLCLVVPLQELLSRGFLQGIFELLLDGTPRRRMWMAIAVSNLIFSAFHIYLSMAVALSTLLLGVYLGWMYTRTRHLLAPCLTHGIVGLWALTVVRLQNIFLG